MPEVWQKLPIAIVTTHILYKFLIVTTQMTSVSVSAFVATHAHTRARTIWHRSWM